MNPCECGCGGVPSEGCRFMRGHTWKNKKRSAVSRERMRQANLGEKNPFYGRHHSLENRTKWSEARLGKPNVHHKAHPQSAKTRRKISKRLKGTQGWVGLKHSEKTKDKLSAIMTGKYAGSKHHNWKGGIHQNPYDSEFNLRLKQRVKKRDRYSCQFPQCHSKKRLSIHHIDFDKMNSAETNLFTLCGAHNIKVNYDREHWIVYFQIKKRGEI